MQSSFRAFREGSGMDYDSRQGLVSEERLLDSSRCCYETLRLNSRGWM